MRRFLQPSTAAGSGAVLPRGGIRPMRLPGPKCPTVAISAAYAVKPA
jgi:hypothetical protein